MGNCGVKDCTGTSSILQCPACKRATAVRVVANKALRAWEDLHKALADLHVATIDSDTAAEVTAVRKRLLETKLWDLLDNLRR